MDAMTSLCKDSIIRDPVQVHGPSYELRVPQGCPWLGAVCGSVDRVGAVRAGFLCLRVRALELLSCSLLQPLHGFFSSVFAVYFLQHGCLQYSMVWQER